MPFARHLSLERISALHAVASAISLDQGMLLVGMDPTFVATLPDLPPETSRDRLLITLHRLNAVEALGDGSVPMRIWLLNARRLARGRGEAVFADALTELDEPRGGDMLSNGRYELVEHLGKGIWGTVWKARDHEARSSVAVKFLLADPGQKALDRFRRGARCMAKLNHPNVVRVVQEASVEEIRGSERWFFVMECLMGGTLKQRVVQGQWDRGRALRAVVEAGLGLSCVHKEGMVHTAVSPDKILIDNEGMAKLTNFDSVKEVSAYSAPELSGAGVRSDVFALGMTALLAVYGKELPNAAIDGRKKLVAELDCPVELKAVLDKATDSEPDARYASVEELCAALERAMRRVENIEGPASTSRAPSPPNNEVRPRPAPKAQAIPRPAQRLQVVEPPPAPEPWDKKVYALFRPLDKLRMPLGLGIGLVLGALAAYPGSFASFGRALVGEVALVGAGGVVLGVAAALGLSARMEREERPRHRALNRALVLAALLLPMVLLVGFGMVSRKRVPVAGEHAEPKPVK